MLKLTALAPTDAQPDDTLTLTHELRQKSRLRIHSDGGVDTGLFLPRSNLLRPGDRLQAEDGRIFVIRAQAEAVSVVRCLDPWLLARVSYHLGNRHVALQIEPGELRYLQDHVLDDMVRQLGLEISHEQTGFEPEQGAYHTGHAHGH